MIKHLEQGNFEEAIKEGIVLVDFYADWCGPCKMLGPVLEQLAAKRTDVTILKVDVEAREDIAMQFKIMSIPTMHLYKNGAFVSQRVGFASSDMLEAFIDQK